MSWQIIYSRWASTFSRLKSLCLIGCLRAPCSQMKPIVATCRSGMRRVHRFRRLVAATSGLTKQREYPSCVALSLSSCAVSPIRSSLQWIWGRNLSWRSAVCGVLATNSARRWSTWRKMNFTQAVCVPCASFVITRSATKLLSRLSLKFFASTSALILQLNRCVMAQATYLKSKRRA